jgi:hypothetical protein
VVPKKHKYVVIKHKGRGGIWGATYNGISPWQRGGCFGKQNAHHFVFFPIIPWYNP